MDIKKSAIKDILDERRHERLMENWGLISIGIILGVAFLLFLNAFIVSKQIEDKENCILPRNDAQMLNGYNK